MCIQVTGKMLPLNGFNQRFKKSDSPLCNEKNFHEVLLAGRGIRAMLALITQQGFPMQCRVANVEVSVLNSGHFIISVSPKLKYENPYLAQKESNIQTPKSGLL